MTTENPVLNETRLPRAIRAQMLRVDERIEAKKQAGEQQAQPSAQAAGPDGAPAITSTDSPSGAEAPASTADPRENDPLYWKQRFHVTQGMFTSSQARHSDALAAKDRDIDELRDKLRSLENENSKGRTGEIDLSAFFTPDQIERFGEDQCKAMAQAATKAARDQAQALIDAEVKPIQERSKADAQRVEDDKETKFWTGLAEAVPDYEQINADQQWLAWLAEVDEATGLGRQDILDSHRAARSARGVAKLFLAFKASRQKAPPPIAAPSSAGAGSAAAPAAIAKGYPTREEIRDFYKRAASTRKVSDQERIEFETRLKSKAAA